ncbi:MAG: glucokinase [Telluria sp.]|nr:glucokinase [Telluria sp.]
MTVPPRPALPQHATPAAFAHGPRLLADIGGTNARFALEVAPGEFRHIEVLACDAYPTLAHALHAYLGMAGLAAGAIRHAGLAIANPVDGDLVRMTNHHWEFSIEAMRRACGFDTLLVVNDFSALARSLPHLAAEHKRQVGAGSARPCSPLGLVGAGTGLGVSGLIPAGEGWSALRSEGGHVSFSPADETEVAILQFAWRTLGHVSAERFLSGDGIELIHRALALHAGLPAPTLRAEQIARRACAAECALCDQAIETFCGMLGTVAGNLAITLGAQGGIYIGGGIVPKLGERFERSSFRARFERKGRFSGYLAQVPTFVITAEYPAFLGVSTILSEKLG